jgi:hypothetical protein
MARFSRNVFPPKLRHGLGGTYLGYCTAMIKTTLGKGRFLRFYQEKTQDHLQMKVFS